MKNKIQQKGFTLIELLVVIVILGILSTISVGTFRSYFAKARDSERVSTVQNLAMMMKVDSGGAGDCSVYNYVGGGATCATSILLTELKGLLEDNDYSMPDEKNGLVYHYGFNKGATDGDNEFFVIIGSEEDIPQNGKEVASTGNYVFVDGTTRGIASAIAGAQAAPIPASDTLGTCDWVSGAPLCTTATDWTVYTINADGELTVVTP